MNEENKNNYNENKRIRVKKSFHYSSIQDSKFKHKFFNTDKKNVRSSEINTDPFKIKRNSQMARKIDNKKNTFFSVLSKINDVHSMQEYNYLFPYKKTANILLRKKYNCSQKIYIKMKLYKKEEIISKYDTYKIQNLIENKKSSIYCKFKEILIFSNKKEYLYHEYNLREEKILLKYLLFFIYDKDRMTFNKNLSEKVEKDKLKSAAEKIKQTLDKKHIINLQNINKTKKTKNNKASKKHAENNISENSPVQKYSFIYNLSPFDIHNSIPNLLPSGEKILHALNEYLKKKLCQKLYDNKFYCKNISEGMDSTFRYNKSTKDNKNSKSKTINNISVSKIIFRRKKNNTINNNQDDFKRIKNDINTNDIEKLIKKLVKGGQKLKKNNSINSHIKKTKFHFNSSNNNIERSFEKNQLSQNSTTLTAMNRENNLSHRTNLINNSASVSDIKNFFKNKLFIINLDIKKKIYKNNNKKLFKNSFGYNLRNNSPKSIRIKNYGQYSIQNNHLRNTIFNENNSESNSKIKLLSLKQFLKLENKSNHNLNKKRPIKIYKPKRGFEYQNDMYIFTKDLNKNVWEKGEDINCQTKAQDIRAKIMKKIKSMKSKNLVHLNKCYTFRKLVKYGEIYYKNYKDV